MCAFCVLDRTCVDNAPPFLKHSIKSSGVAKPPVALNENILFPKFAAINERLEAKRCDPTSEPPTTLGHGGSWGRIFCLASLVVNMAPQGFPMSPVVSEFRPNGITTYIPPPLIAKVFGSQCVTKHGEGNMLHKVSFPTFGKGWLYHPTKPHKTTITSEMPQN